MRHCCRFKADDIYYLVENDLYTSRNLSIGFCPICNKPVAELVEYRFDGEICFTRVSGIEANDLMLKLKDEILYSMKECNYMRFKSKPFGWKYGVNKTIHSKNGVKIKQYAYDFYGNKELIKTI